MQWLACLYRPPTFVSSPGTGQVAHWGLVGAKVPCPPLISLIKFPDSQDLSHKFSAEPISWCGTGWLRAQHQVSKGKHATTGQEWPKTNPIGRLTGAWAGWSANSDLGRLSFEPWIKVLVGSKRKKLPVKLPWCQARKQLHLWWCTGPISCDFKH